VIISGPIAVHGIAIMSVREGLEFETEIASDDSRYVEQIVDESRLRTCVALDRLDRAGGVRAFDFAVPDHRRPTENRRQGRAQLMRERREKLILETIGFFSVFACILLAREGRRSFVFRTLP